MSQQPKLVMAKVQRCKYCKREMGCSALAYVENPFCTRCRSERVAAAAPTEQRALQSAGHYFTRLPTPEKRSSGGRRRPHA